ncbi:MAG: FAD-dependent oxidoreductase [Erysipelotrichaceae bacterium]|nr:FAD-dependent oxidoreductase [Erysipelotrichaceae bacterium]
MVYDVIVVGGGAAGMTAALYALRNGKTVMILEKEGFGGQITHSPKVENFPGTLSMSGNEFADKLFDQILAQGAEFEIDDVVSVEDGEVKTVRTADGNVYEGLTVILATGVKHRVLGVEGEEELIGEGISFCAVCDGDFYADKTVCVIGGGNSALQEAILLAEKCRKVIMLQDLSMFTGEERLQQTLFRRENVEAYTDQKVTGFQTADGRLTGVRTMDKKTGSETVYFCDGVFEAIGLIPKNDAFKELADLNDWGYFDTDERCMTKTPGIFVAGDCRQKTIRQLTTAVADGSSAALAACRYINERK